jgi:pimeloyl-ACP methyl ester carboxylesterase
LQHGLGGDSQQIADLIGQPPPGFRLIAMDARGHGRSVPLGDPNCLRFDSMSEDVIGLLDHLELDKAVVGGISMGAGVALNLATRYPSRLHALILIRPVWLDSANPPHLAVFSRLGALLRAEGPDRGRRLFEETEEYHAMYESAPACALSLLDQFREPRAVECLERLERIPRDCPAPDRARWRSLRVPTLVLANDQDPIHPLAVGRELAREIPGSRFEVITSKSVSATRHTKEAREHIGDFLSKCNISTIGNA